MIDGMITVRSESKRLPQKCFLPFGDCNVLEHVIRRAKYFDINPIVCTTIESSDNKIIEIAKKENVRYFRGSVRDKLKRWRDACLEHEIASFISIDADDPFFDGELSIKSYRMLGKSFDLIKHPTQQPNYGFYEGCVGYSITLDIINKACQLKTTSNTEMMWTFIENVPAVRIGYAEMNSDKKISFPIRLTLDYEEDYWLMRSISRIIGQFATRKEIVEIFANNPDLYKINWFRNDDYKIAQNK